MEIIRNILAVIGGIAVLGGILFALLIYTMGSIAKAHDKITWQGGNMHSDKYEDDNV